MIGRRLPGTQHLCPLINIAEFKKPVYSIYVASLVINALALFTVRTMGVRSKLTLDTPLFQVYTYLTVSAVNAGLSANLSFDLLAIANAISSLGQIGSGLLADRYGTLTY